MEKKSESIYIMLSYTGTILSRIVKICTQKEYSHISIALDLEFDELFSFGRINPRNPFSGGFIKEEIDSGTYKLFGNTRCAIYSMKVTKEQHDKLKIFIEDFKEEQDAYRFNLVGMLGALVRKPINRDYHYFCSQFVGKGLLNAGIHDFKKDIGLLKPIDFLQMPGLTSEYEGKLADYPQHLTKP